MNKFEGKVTSERFKKLIKLCASVSSELNLFIEKNKILIQARHSSNIKMVESSITPEAFEKYICNKNFLVKIDTANILKFLSYIKLPNSILDVTITDDYLILHSEQYKLKNKFIDSSFEKKFILPDERKKTDEKPPLQFDYAIEINANEFSDKVKSSNSIYDVVTLTIDKKELKVCSSNEIGEFEATINNINYKKFKDKTTSKYSAPFLLSFLESLKGKILIKAGEGLPIKIEKQLFPFVETKFILAPISDIDE